MNFCFNELCLKNKASDPYQADIWIRGLIDILKQAYSVDRELPSLRTQDGLYSLMVGTDYNIARWVNSNLVDRDIRSFLLTVKDRSPYLDSQLDTLKHHEASRMDFFYETQQALGLGYAWLLDEIAVSFPSVPEWICSYVSIRVDTLNEIGEIYSEYQDIRHVSQTNHLREHSDFYKSLNRYYQEISTLSDLQEKSAVLLPGLIFGDEAWEWMKNVPLSKQQFHLIVRHLYNLNQFFRDQVPQGNTNLTQIPNSSNESQSTRQQYYNERCFKFGCERYYCEWHLKVHSLNVRIHYKPDFKDGVAYVGYIGKHLKTALYN